jgi:hypothetical protein
MKYPSNNVLPFTYTRTTQVRSIVNKIVKKHTFLVSYEQE